MGEALVGDGGLFEVKAVEVGQFLRDGQPCQNPELTPGDWVVVQAAYTPEALANSPDGPLPLDLLVLYLN